jgi:hypothetical protein
MEVRYVFLMGTDVFERYGSLGGMEGFNYEAIDEGKETRTYI